MSSLGRCWEDDFIPRAHLRALTQLSIGRRKRLLSMTLTKISVRQSPETRKWSSL